MVEDVEFPDVSHISPVLESKVKFVGEHPLIFTFLSMALCGALCYTECSQTPKLEFKDRVPWLGMVHEWTVGMPAAQEVVHSIIQYHFYEWSVDIFI